VIFISQSMKTYTPSEFYRGFLSLSENLTLAELRMLYLLITEPETICLSQEEFASKIHTHRRTINIGLRKFRECGIITNEKVSNDVIVDERFKDIPKQKIGFNKRYIIDRVIDFYQLNNDQQIVNEDFYNIILGCKSLHKKLKNNKEFINETIIESFPNYKFHFSLNKSDYKTEMEYSVISYLNREIIRLREEGRYSIHKKNFLDYLWENHDVPKKDVFEIVKSNFPRIKISEHRLVVQKHIRDTLQKNKPNERDKYLMGRI